MDDFLYFLVTVGFPVTGLTIVLVYYFITRYKERKAFIEKGIDVVKDSSIFPISKTAILRIGIICIGLSFGMLAGILLMDIVSNPVLSEDEGIAWGITVPFFVGLSLIISYFIGKEK